MERKMKATKGQTVYILGTWNDFNVMSIRKVCVHSWGKKLAKFVDMTTGQMIQQQYRLQNGDEPTFSQHWKTLKQKLRLSLKTKLRWLWRH
jgi:hypothetical protein